MTEKKSAAKKTAAKKPRGRQSTFTQAVADEICERLSSGETLQSICSGEGMPAVRTVSDWTMAHESFAASFAQARARGFDAIAAETMQIADDDSRDWEPVKDAEGQVIGVKVDGEHVQRSKLRIETRLKLLAKWDPKRYGDKLAIGGADDLPPIKTMTDEALEARIAALHAKVSDGGNAG